MIEYAKTRYGIPYHYVWFATRPGINAAFLPATFMHCPHLRQVPGFIREEKFTKTIDITQPAESLLAGMKKRTSYEIKRAERDGVGFRSVESRDEFLGFYNAFADTKRLPRIDAGQLGSWGKHIFGLAAFQDGDDLAMHSYIVDPSESRACLLHSASLYRNAADSTERNLVGRANRYLHFKAMMFFKERGIATYDFGGYAVHAKTDDLLNINRFKDMFGGELVQESTYYSIPMYALKLAGRIMNRLRER